MTEAWLPEEIDYNSFGGQWEPFEKAVYNKFKEDFLDSKPELKGQMVQIKIHPKTKNKEWAFWHLVSENLAEGETEGDRVVDINRGKKIGWVRALIEKHGSQDVSCWEKDAKKDKRLLIALNDFSYVVVIALKGEYTLLLTAYSVEYPNRRRRLKKEFSENS